MGCTQFHIYSYYPREKALKMFRAQVTESKEMCKKKKYDMELCSMSQNPTFDPHMFYPSQKNVYSRVTHIKTLDPYSSIHYTDDSSKQNQTVQATRPSSSCSVHFDGQKFQLSYNKCYLNVQIYHRVHIRTREDI